MKGVGLLTGVFLTFYAYAYVTADGQSASWWFYSAQGFLGAYCCILLFLKYADDPLVRIAAAWGFFEEAQAGIAGLITIDRDAPVPLWSGVLREAIGPLPYVAVAVGLCIYAWHRYESKD